MLEKNFRNTGDYDARLAVSDYVPMFSYGRPILRDKGDPDRFFLMYLFYEEADVIQFPNDVGILRSTTKCNSCCPYMKWSPDSSVSEGFRWRC